MSVDPLTRSYPWNSPYSFAENDVIRTIDVDGTESQEVINKAKTIRDNWTPAQGNTIILTPISSTLYSKGTIPKPICCDVQFRKEYRPIYKNVKVGGLDGYDNFMISNGDSELKIIDNYSYQLFRYNGIRAQQYLAESNLDLATLFAPGPVIFKKGKYLKSFLTNSRFQNVIKGVSKVSLNTAQKGFKFKNLNRIKELNGSIKRIQNLINHNFEADDLEGVIKEIHGFSSNGQHLKKVTDGISGLKNQINQLTQYLDSGELFGEAKAAANTAIKAAKGAIKYAGEVIDSAQKSATP